MRNWRLLHMTGTCWNEFLHIIGIIAHNCYKGAKHVLSFTIPRTSGRCFTPPHFTFNATSSKWMLGQVDLWTEDKFSCIGIFISCLMFAVGSVWFAYPSLLGSLRCCDCSHLINQRKLGKFYVRGCSVSSEISCHSPTRNALFSLILLSWIFRVADGNVPASCVIRRRHPHYFIHIFPFQLFF